MHAAFLRDGRMIEKQVHQHRLAAPHPAPDVKPFRRRHRTADAKDRESTDLLARHPFRQILMQMLKPLHGARLRCVCGDLAGRNLGAIEMDGAVRHIRANSAGGT